MWLLGRKAEAGSNKLLGTGDEANSTELTEESRLDPILLRVSTIPVPGSYSLTQPLGLVSQTARVGRSNVA